MNKPEQTWYNNVNLVGTLVYVVPPLGIYALYRSSAISLKYKVAISISLSLAFIAILVNWL